MDAAVALLREAHGPLHVEELCRLALERGLLDSPGTSPLRSLKGRLTTELKRGPESRVARIEDDVWGLAGAGPNRVEADEAERSGRAPRAGRAADTAVDAGAAIVEAEEAGGGAVEAR
ncbi:MAG TPA: winged helix-turn-helix domain-containing protein, partial [Kofleriaceae bacterium]|nr:winged helix-turn-helix domain-containing protein [Kofleriaceae bacterium]